MRIAWSRDSAAVFGAAGPHQRPDAGEGAQHVGPRRRLREVAARGFEDEVDLRLAWRAARAARRGWRRRWCRRACGRATGSRTAPGRRASSGPAARVSPGRNERSRTTWLPWLAATSGAAAGSARRRTPSQNGPAAFTTTRAAARNSAPRLRVANDDAVDRARRRRASGRRPARSSGPSRRGRPRSSARWISSRASSNWPSW